MFASRCSLIPFCVYFFADKWAQSDSADALAQINRVFKVNAKSMQIFLTFLLEFCHRRSACRERRKTFVRHSSSLSQLLKLL